MPSNKTSPIEISPAARTILESLSRQAAGEHRLVQRAKLILQMAEGLPNIRIARNFQINRETVRDWRKRWQELTPELQAAEASPQEALPLRQLILQGLADKERPGAPATFTAQQVTQIIAVACENPADSKYPVSHWDPGLLATEVIRREIVSSISPTSVRRFLKSGRLEALAY